MKPLRPSVLSSRLGVLVACLTLLTVTAHVHAAAPTKPDRALPEHEITSGIYPSFEQGGLVITDDAIRINLWANGFTGEVSTLNLRIKGIDRTGPKPVLNTVVTEYRERLHDKPRFRQGQALPLEVSFDRFGRLALKPLVGDATFGRNEPTWFGNRPPTGWAEHDDIPADGEAGPLGILGPWVASQRWPVKLGPTMLRFGADNWQAAVYDIIEWTVADGEPFARLDTDYIAGYDQRLIDMPVLMLLRRDADGYSVAFFPPEANRPEEWPTSFTHSEDNPVQVISFSPSQPAK